MIDPYRGCITPCQCGTGSFSYSEWEGSNQTTTNHNDEATDELLWLYKRSSRRAVSSGSARTQRCNGLERKSIAVNAIETRLVKIGFQAVTSVEATNAFVSPHSRDNAHRCWLGPCETNLFDPCCKFLIPLSSFMCKSAHKHLKRCCDEDLSLNSSLPMALTLN